VGIILAALLLTFFVVAAVVLASRHRESRKSRRTSFSDDESGVQSTANNDVFFVSASPKDNESAADTGSSPRVGSWAAPRSVSKSYLDVFANKVAPPPSEPVRPSSWSMPGVVVPPPKEEEYDASYIGQTGRNPTFKRNSMASVGSDNDSLFDEDDVNMFEGGNEVSLLRLVGAAR
jgi:hypothetical protein